MWNPFEGLQQLEIFHIFDRPKRNAPQLHVGAHITGLNALGDRIRTTRRDKELVPDAEGQYVHKLGVGAVELNLTHREGEAVLIIRHKRPVLLTADTSQVVVSGVTHLPDTSSDSIFAFELSKHRPVRLKIAKNARPIHGSLHGFEITPTR